MFRSLVSAFLLLLLASPALLGGENWRPLFNGKDLSNFQQINGWATYDVVDGTILGRTSEGSPNSFLCTRNHYSDFELKLEVKVDDSLNSGVQIRSNSFKEYNKGRVHGYQVEIATNGSAGFIYDEARRGWLSKDRSDAAARAAFKKGEWNRYRIRCEGPSMKTWVNDVPVADVRDAMTSSGFIGLQVHGIKKGTGPFEVRWRNLSIRELPPKKLLTRRIVTADDGSFQHVVAAKSWEPENSALIICDMWDLHHSLYATRRTGELAPRINAFAESLRAQGTLVIHAPSSCMNSYADHPGRKRAMEAPQAAHQPKDITKWCRQIPAEEAAKFPVDHSDGGDDTPAGPQSRHEAELKEMGRSVGGPWVKQIDTIRIDDSDVISSKGDEIWNVLEDRKIDNVFLVGVHTNMCVLGRPFGLRQMSRNGKNTILVRDLTDTMYNPARWPYVNHFRGTDRVIGHIEKFVCPTITSDQLLGGSTFRFKDDKSPRVVFIVGEQEYSTAKTLPLFAHQELETRGVHCSFVNASDSDGNDFPGLETIKEADLVILSVRRRALSLDQMAALEGYLQTRKPLVGIRTSSHAFGRDPKDENHVAWHEFDTEVLGAKYEGHWGNKPPKGPASFVKTISQAKDHPILRGVPPEEIKVPSHLYKTRQPGKNVTPLMTGRVDGKDIEEVVTWTNNREGQRIFYTSLGHPDEFEMAWFRTLLVNGIFWALDAPVPEVSEESLAANG